jgi:hypothetical protein
VPVVLVVLSSVEWSMSSETTTMLYLFTFIFAGQILPLVFGFLIIRGIVRWVIREVVKEVKKT